MSGKRIHLGQRLLFLLLAAVVVGQVAFVLWGGPQRSLAISRLELTLPVQGGPEEGPEFDDGLLAEPAPLKETPALEEGELAPGAEAVAPGGPSLGSIPVAFGENAPGDVPARAGLPRPGGPGQAGGEQSGPGGGGRPRANDAYRRALLTVYYLEREGGDLALTRAQARHLLDLVRRMEDIKGAVPEARLLLLDTLTPEQLESMRARHSATRSQDGPLPPQELDKDAQRALDKLGK